jgi:hypothetical protein
MWFCACIWYVGVREDRAEPLWEEQFVLVSGESEADAESRAQQIGKQHEHTYRAQGSIIRWTFRAVHRIHAIEESLGDGTEVFSRFLRAAEVESLAKPFE